MIKVLIVNETRLMCSVLGAVLREEEDIYVMGYATNVDEALARVKKADVVLVDDALANEGAIQITDAINKKYPSTNILITGVEKQPEKIVRYIEAGASGYVLEEVELEDLLENIRAVDDGEGLVEPEIVGKLIARLNELSQLCADTEGILQKAEILTPRECEVLECVSEGLTNKEIGERLTIEVGTVKNHIHNILDKLDVGNRHKAAEIFQQHQQLVPANGNGKK